MRHRRLLQKRLELIEKALLELQAARRICANRLIKPAPVASTRLAELGPHRDEESANLRHGSSLLNDKNVVAILSRCVE